ncbi:outer membrane protein assembly factor BamD [bacterium]|nr:outer membrane protein assembly factor BamD [bacterium]
MNKCFGIIITATVILFSGCAGIMNKNMSAEQHLKKGLELHDRRDYKAAQKHLKISAEQIQNQDLLPKTLYLYGETLFNLNKFSQASQQYSRIVWSFPDDSLAAIARHKVDECYNSQFRDAMKKYKNEDFLDARDALKVIILSSRATTVIDSARFFYAGCFYEVKEYILAISEYQRLMKFYPKSHLMDDSQYQIGMCFYKLSPKYALDQDYTNKAIQEFQAFLEDFPDSPRRSEAHQRYLELRGKLAEKDFKTGELYRKMKEFRPAEIAYQDVINKFYDTEYAPISYFQRAECLRKLEDFAAAKAAYTTYLEKYPKHKSAARAKRALHSISQQPSN